MTHLKNGLLFEIKDEPSDEIDLSPPPDRTDYDNLLIEVSTYKKELEMDRRELEVLRTLIATKNSQIARLGGYPVIFSKYPAPEGSTKQVTVLPLEDWVKTLTPRDKLQVIFGREKEVVVKCLVNITSGASYIYDEEYTS